MGSTLCLRSNSLDFQHNDMLQFINRIKRAPNQDLLSLLQDYIVLETTRLSNNHIKKFLKIQERLVNEINKRSMQEKIPRNFSQIAGNPLENLNHILVSINQELQSLKNLYRHNEKIIQEKSSGQLINFQKHLEKGKYLGKPAVAIQLTQSSKSKSQNEILLNDNSYDERAEVPFYSEEKIEEIIQELDRSKVFNKEEEIELSKVKHIVMGQLGKIKNISKKSDENKSKIWVDLQNAESKIVELNEEIKNLLEKNKKLEDIEKILSMKISKLQQHIQGQKSRNEKVQSTNNAQQTSKVTSILGQQPFEKVSEIASESYRKRDSIILNFACSNTLACSQNRISFYFRQKIQEMFRQHKLTIINTKKIFCFDHVQPNNMFEYIKNYQRLIILIKINNGVIIGGFSENNWTQPRQNNFAFIFSIPPSQSHEQYKKLSPKKGSSGESTVSIDSDFLKFGANEIRIRCKSNEGFANIASSAAIYQDPSGGKVNVENFLYQKQFRFSIKDYQIYSLELCETESPLKKEKKMQRSGSSRSRSALES